MLSLHDHDLGIKELRLDRSELHNAFNDEVILQLSNHLKHLSEDETTKVLLLSASGKSFCAGADIKWMQSMVHYSYEENFIDAMKLAGMLKRLYQFPKPTIALVQGTAFGGGIGLIACCDIAFALPEARFCFSEVSLGLTPATISPYVIAAIGERAARRYFLTAEIFDAKKACELSLIHEVLYKGELLAHGINIAKILCGHGQEALRAAKELIQTVSRSPLSEELIKKTAHNIADRRVSAEAQERLTAFLCSKKS